LASVAEAMKVAGVVYQIVIRHRVRVIKETAPKTKQTAFERLQKWRYGRNSSHLVFL